MEFISRWLEKRGKAVEVLVVDVMREYDPRISGLQIQKKDIVRAVGFSWPDELDHKPWFVTSLEIDAALNRLVNWGRLRPSHRCDANGPRPVDTDMFAFRT